jgi:hypothetical protein
MLVTYDQFEYIDVKPYYRYVEKKSSLELVSQLVSPNVVGYDDNIETSRRRMIQFAKTSTSINLSRFDFLNKDDYVGNALDFATVIQKERIKSLSPF